ncbi:MAG: hypothetical protein J1F36_00145 [Clostridiales bacterium]|nr:hypothetical protein [Clostridiales bacterium]
MNNKECRNCKSYKAFYTIYNGIVQDTGQGECTAQIKIVTSGTCKLWRRRKEGVTIEELDGAIENLNAIMRIYGE